MPSIHIESEAHWHELRAKHVGASETAALPPFNMHKYLTPFDLHHQKRGTYPPEDLSGNERVVIGQCVEPAIAKATEQLHGVKMRKVHRYLTHPSVEGMGASLDYELLTEDAGWVPAEIKNIDLAIWLDQWEADPETGEYDAPPHIELQLQHQLSCANKPYGFLVACVGGNRIYLLRREAHEELQEKIEAAVEEFWNDVATHTEPDPDLERDFTAMTKAWKRAHGAEDMTDDENLSRLMEQYARWQQNQVESGKLKDAAKAQIFEYLNEKEVVVASGGKVSMKLKPAQEERQVTYKAQPEKRDVRITVSKELKEKVRSEA